MWMRPLRITLSNGGRCGTEVTAETQGCAYSELHRPDQHVGDSTGARAAALKWKLTTRDYAELVPLSWKHANPHGRFDLDMKMRSDGAIFAQPIPPANSPGPRSCRSCPTQSRIARLKGWTLRGGLVMRISDGESSVRLRYTAGIPQF